jgi:hypothetical protein
VVGQGVTDVGLIASPSVHIHKMDTVVAEMMVDGGEGPAAEAMAAIPIACESLIRYLPTRFIRPALLPLNENVCALCAGVYPALEASDVRFCLPSSAAQTL